MGAGGGLRVILYTEDRSIHMSNALDGAVVEVEMCELELRRSRDRTIFLRSHGEPVILRGDLDGPLGQVLDRVVPAVVAERPLHGRATRRKTQKLMTEADTEDRRFTNQFADRLVRVLKRFGVTGAVG